MKLGLRPADGSAGAAGPDRPGHGVRDPRHDVPAVPRPAARARAGAQADGHGRSARPQDRPRLLHLRRRRTRPVVVADGRRRCPSTTARTPAPAVRTARARCGGSAWSAPARWRPGIVEVLRQGRRTTSATSPAARRRSPAVRAALERSLDKAVLRGKLDAAGPGRGARPGLGQRRGWTTWPTATSCVEAVVEELLGQAGAVRDPRRDPAARRGARDDHVQPAGGRAGRRDRAPRRRRGHALLQPRAGHAARRGRLDGERPPRRRRPPRWPCASAWASTR